MFHRAVIAAALCFAFLPSAHAELPAPVSDQLAKLNIPQDAMAALVIRIPDGAVLLSHQADRPMQPASTMKLVPTITGLNKLGPMFRGRTVLQSGAEIRGETLQGDLVLRGLADADLNWEALQSMLQALRHKGIKHIKGDLLIDRGLYTPARLDVGVPPFDEAPEARYNVIPDALGLNLNLLKVELNADQKALNITSMPNLQGVTITHDMTLIEKACKGDWDDGWLPPTVERRKDKLNIVLHGTYPKDCVKSTELNVLDRTEYTERLFRTLWKQLGGTFKGDVKEGAAPADLRQLAEHRSRPLSELLRDINKPSDNTFARLLTLNLGTYTVDSPVAGNASLLKPEPADTLQRAEREIRTWMRAQGIDDTGMVLENGSGLSRLERIKPLQLAGLLQAGYNSIWAPELMASLPIGGVDGTMRLRLKDSTAAGRARVKTGTLRNVVAIAGYVLDAQGRQNIVVGMINWETMKSSQSRQALDALIDWVARSGQ